MFSWATQQLENLAQTVAPPPTDALSRFAYCIQRNDEVAAQSCLAEIDPLMEVVQPTKGAYPLHLACQYSMNNIIRQIMNIPGANTNIVDYAGNTPLHYACLSENKVSMDTVRLLVTQFGASVVAKNSEGQTPYDLASVNSVRQYLLPLQLQQETRDALDNGGIGLPPGIDMGGLQIRNSALPPPPIGGLSAPPPSTPGPTPDANYYGMMTTPSPNVPAKYAVQNVSDINPVQSATSSPAVPPPAPTSGQHSYSRTGHSSAAIFSNKYKSDGFHSSSSDVNLQIKYGHSSSGNLAAAVPPPPSSGNSTSVSAPSSSGYAGAANPYAAFGGGAMKARYPVYNNNPGIPIAAVPMSGGYNFAVAPPAPGIYTMFNPVGAAAQTGITFQQQVGTQQQSGHQQPQTVPYTQPGYPQTNSAPATPSTTFFPPPPLSSMSPPNHQQPTYPQSASKQQEQNQLNIASPYNSNGSRGVLLGHPQQQLGNASPYVDTVLPQQSPASGNAQQRFSSQPAPASGNAQQFFLSQPSPVSGDAHQLFSTPATPVSDNAAVFVCGPTPESGISSNEQKLAPHSQLIKESACIATEKRADNLLGSSSSAYAPSVTTEAPTDHSTSIAHEFEAPELNVEKASVFVTPISYAEEEPLVKTITQDTTLTSNANRNGIHDPLPEQILKTSKHEKPSSEIASSSRTHPAAVSAASVFGSPNGVGESPYALDSDDGMMDVPLSPEGQTQLLAPCPQQAAVDPATTNSAAALFGSIGMPPPPFFSKP